MSLTQSELSAVIMSCSCIKIDQYMAVFNALQKFIEGKTSKNIEAFVSKILVFALNLRICDDVKAIPDLRANRIFQILKSPIWFRAYRTESDSRIDRR